MKMTLHELIDASVECERRSQLFELFQEYLDDYDIDVASYHQVRERLEDRDFGDSLKFFSFPDRWVQHYTKSKYYDIDPIIQTSKRLAEPFRWFEISKLITLTDDQMQFLEDLKATGLKDGWAITVFGPQGDVAYFGLGAWDDELNYDEATISEIHLACHQIHFRFCEITSDTDDSDDVSLSPREREVMQWVARGKSNSVIAEILGISEHTVDTNLRRVFKKLGVNTRITAAVKAIGLGVISA